MNCQAWRDSSGVRVCRKLYAFRGKHLPCLGDLRTTRKPGDQRKMVPEIPPRQLVDGSDPAIHEPRPFLNPTNGSWWIVQIPPTKRNAMKNENPPNGSWGIVQIRPSFPQKVHVAEIAFDCVRIALFRRLDLNNPPTSVGGIFKTPQVLPCR